MKIENDLAILPSHNTEDVPVHLSLLELYQVLFVNSDKEND